MSQYKKPDGTFPTVTVTNGLPTVTVQGVDASAAIAAGHDFYVNGEATRYQVSGTPVYSAPDTIVTLSVPYGGATDANAIGVFHRDFADDDSGQSLIPIAYPRDINLASILGRLGQAAQTLLNLRLRKDANLADLDNTGTARTNLDVFSRAELTGAVTATTDGIDAIFINPETVYRTFPQLRYRRSGVRTYVDGYGQLKTADYATGTADASSTPGQLVDTTKSWTLGHWAYAMIYIVSGTGAGKYRWCVANSATALMPDRPFDAIDGDSVYEVMQLPVSWGWHSAGAGTNKLSYANDYSNAAWTKVNLGTPSQTITGPDGVANSAWSMPEPSDASAASHYWYQSVSHTPGDEITFSQRLKANGRNAVLRINGAFFTDGQVREALFDLSAGTTAWTGTGTDPGAANIRISPLADGWYECSISATCEVTASAAHLVLLHNGSGTSYIGDGTSGVYGYGSMSEPLSFPSDYIHTTTASATRARDQISFELHGIAYNSLSWLVDYEYDGMLATYTGPVCTDNATAGTGALYQYSHGSAENIDSFRAGGAYTPTTDTPSAGTRYRDVMTYDNETGVVVAYRDGEQVGTVSGGAMVVGESAIGYLMGNADGTNNLPGRLYRFRLIPGALTAAQARVW